MRSWGYGGDVTGVAENITETDEAPTYRQTNGKFKCTVKGKRLPASGTGPVQVLNNHAVGC